MNDGQKREMEGRQNILKDFIGMERLFNGTLYNPENYGKIIKWKVGGGKSKTWRTLALLRRLL